MANLPVKASQNSFSEASVDKLVLQLAKGKHPREIALQIYPKHADRSRRRALYLRLRRAIINDPRIAQGVAEEAKVQMIMGLGPASAGLVRSAGRGRIDAVKLLFEASGFHNPKVSHEHSGEIKVKLEIPRPTFDVPDADVVEDDA